MHQDVEKVLISREKLEKRVKELGTEITKEYKNEPLLIVGILKGALIFMADLVRNIGTPVALDFMVVSSYGAQAKSSGAVRILKDLERSIEGWHVLIVEDIIDTGLTLKYLVENLKSRQPKSVKICTLLDKPGRRQIEVEVDYNGFSIPDEFVVGYGLDYNERYRNLPDVNILKPEVYGG